MEIKFKVDTPAAKVDFEFSSSGSETGILLNDPVYQRLGEVVIEQIRRYAQDEGGHWRDMRSQNYHDNNHKANDRVDALRRVVETEHKCQTRHNEAVDKAISNLQDHVSKMLDRIVKDIRSKS